MSRPTHQGQLTTESLLWTAGVVVGSSLPHWPYLELWVPALLAACVMWRLGSVFAGLPLPNAIIRIGLALGAFAGVLMEYHTINGIEAGSALLIVMVALKFLEARRIRDHTVLMMIAYFLVFAGLLYERGFLTIAYMIGFVWLTTVGLLRLGQRSPLLDGRRSLKLAARMLAQALPVMAVLFLLFPRLPGPLWSMPGTDMSGSSGLDDEMSPGDLTDLGLSEAVAFRVEFDGRAPRADQLYWRGPVLSSFNGRTWTRDPGMRRRVADTLQYSGEPIDYRIMLEPHGRRWAFALEMPASWDEDRNIYMDSRYQLQLRFAGANGRLDYRVRSFPDYRAMEPLTEAEQRTYTTLPPRSNPETRELVAGWLADDPAPRALIERALDRFRTGLFFYTLTPPPLGVHAVDDFLFRTLEGFCEHYASAFTFMMRAAGIPARVVTGYQGGELNPLGEYFIIRQSNAHAWTEVWLAGEGWVRVDPTGAVAPERIASGTSQGTRERQTAGSGVNLPWMRDLMLAWDAANTYWNDWVVGYGPGAQSALLESFGVQEPHWLQLAALTMAGLALLAAALTAYLAWQYRQRLNADRPARLFMKFSRRLQRIVPPPQPAEGPVAFGRRAAAALPSAAQPIDDIVSAYLQARYEPDRERRALDRLAALVRNFHPRRYRDADAAGSRRHAQA